MGRRIVWIKNELRLTDNELLIKASEGDHRILPLYIIDPRWFEKIDPSGFEKTGSFRLAFLLESLVFFREQLKQIGGNVVIRVGFPEKIIPDLVDQVNADKVYLSKEVTFDEQRIISIIETQLAAKGVFCEQIWQNTLFHEEDVPWPIRQVPQVFTDFRKEVEKETAVRAEFNKPEEINFVTGIQWGDIPTTDELGVNKESIDHRRAFQFKGGEKAALDRLISYIWTKDLLKSYKQTRNGLLGADFSSKLSPWLAIGCLSPKTIYQEIKKYERERVQNSSTYWLFFELLWRDFFKYMAKQNGASIFKLSGIGGQLPQQDNNLVRFNLWKNGETGQPFIDANMKELKLTGYLSNRGRQLVASYLIHDLQVNWTWGAAWFENRLIDYDPCSNWLNWAYIAGVGNDPQNGRHFNIESQQNRYDPKGNYTDYWLN